MPRVSVGDTFGRWEVIQGKGNNRRGLKTWLCRCECGTEKTVTSQSLKSGGSKSCGCLQREAVKKRNTTHGCTAGGRQTRAYRAWAAMIGRCCSEGNKYFKGYGGRGIRVCDRWRNSFVNFREDMGDPPAGLTLERINVNGNYEPGNCKWATRQEQNANRRSTKLITHNGKTQCIAHWERELGFRRATINQRLRAGWSIEEALKIGTVSQFRSTIE